MKILTDRFIYGLKPSSKRQIFTEPGGFILRIEPTGSKLFYYRYAESGKSKYKKIGKFPAVGLSEAREKHRELVRKRERGELTIVKKTFSDLVDDYLISKSNQYADQGIEIRRIMDKDVIPILGLLDIRTIGKKEIYPVLQGITKRGAPRQSNITLEKISLVFRFACSIGLLENNPCLYMPKEQENEPRRRTLSNNEIRFLLNQNGGTWEIFKFMLFTCCRGGEAKAEKNVDGDIWTFRQIKGNVTTYKRTFLSDSAKLALANIPRLSKQTSLATFARRQNLGWTPHDIRRTVATRLAEKFPIDHIERLLGHRLPKVTAAYNHYSYDKEIRLMLEWWEKEAAALI